MQISPIKLLRSVNWRIVLAAVCAIFALHLLAVFTEPFAAAEAQVLPFLSPDARYAMCRFSTANGPVAVKAALLGPGWVLTVYSETGESLNTSLAAPSRPRTDVSLKLMPSDDRFMGLTPQARGIRTRATSALPVGARSGLVVVRAPDRGQAYRELHDAALLQASCRQLNER